MTRTAVIRMDGDEPHFDRDCMRLVFGLSEAEADQFEVEPDLWELPRHVVRRGHRRRLAYLKRTRTLRIRRPEVVPLLVHYAQREGVRLVYESAEGITQVLVEGGGAPTA